MSVYRTHTSSALYPVLLNVCAQNVWIVQVEQLCGGCEWCRRRRRRRRRSRFVCINILFSCCTVSANARNGAIVWDQRAITISRRGSIVGESNYDIVQWKLYGADNGPFGIISFISFFILECNKIAWTQFVFSYIELFCIPNWFYFIDN